MDGSMTIQCTGWEYDTLTLYCTDFTLNQFSSYTLQINNVNPFTHSQN